MLLCYSTQGGTGGVSFANKNVFGLQKYLRFQNEYNKVEIEHRVVQVWTEIKLVITNRTPASRSCDFVITRLISVQIALHSVQLPLLINKQNFKSLKFSGNLNQNCQHNYKTFFITTYTLRNCQLATFISIILWRNFKF